MHMPFPPSKICAIAVQNINPHDFLHSSLMYAQRDLQKQIWISHPPSPYCCPLMISQWYAHVQCCSPSPAYTAIMHTHTDTHTQQSWNWLKQRRSGAADSHNHTTWEKATDHVLWCAGEWTGKSVIVWWRPQHGEYWHFGWIISRGSWAISLSVQANSRFEHILVGYISLSRSSLANHWKKNKINQ